MRITFLGTSAANAFPEAFCQCENCENARFLGGPSLRKRSSALINNDLLIDLGPDVMAAAQVHQRPLTGVRYCLQTHAHADHLDPSHFLSRSPGYGVVEAPLLNFYTSPATLRLTAQILERDCSPAGFLDPQTSELLNLRLHPIEPYQTFSAGPYRVTAFPANHDPATEPLLFALQSSGRTIFYGTDTAVLSEDVWRGFHRHHLCFDLVILDHTYGPDETGSDHLSARQVIEHLDRLKEEKLLAENGEVYATHIAHEGNPAYPKLAEFAARHGYRIAYDGLSL